MKKHTVPTTYCAKRHQRGVGLIEILVAVLILSLGLLGMAGLQANALKANQGSYTRSQAVMLSYYIFDAMRADRANAIGLAYNMAATCLPGAITTPDLAGNTRRDWLTSLRDNLGDANTTCGAIACDSDGNCTVSITWDDSRAAGGTAQTIQTFETRSRI
ncbi:MAG: type IV pilus modification protein PilV [Hydrogenophaga sp.]|uniref:type IV pilus modification protein PilV n=1 Tax=Hydrogenophaga sp. TaxID=1904254 RepID=UPI002718408C|nr:type IV pilus modification protein PilV [Hydrogenophaga sp.]MDO9506078.1 type IV pilus modification protein PilV [Hydrogenophaga sp.]MDP3628585.1 type IV pilus modification protein PilV [Hydrogenophaga sp.]